jgi:hypothetical protein
LLLDSVGTLLISTIILIGSENNMNAVLCNGRVEVVDIFHDRCIANFIVHLDKSVQGEQKELIGRKYVHYALDYLIHEGIIKKSMWKTHFTTITES